VDRSVPWDPQLVVRPDIYAQPVSTSGLLQWWNLPRFDSTIRNPILDQRIAASRAENHPMDRVG
jgi:hypothetical protein